jgi:sugar lactone lactonase YvrE
MIWNRGHEQGLWVVTPEKHSERLLSPRSYDALGRSRGGDFLYACELGERKIVRIDLENAKETLIPITVPCFINTGSVSTDGRKIVVGVNEYKSDVWLMKDFDPQVDRGKQSDH